MLSLFVFLIISALVLNLIFINTNYYKQQNSRFNFFLNDCKDGTYQYANTGSSYSFYAFDYGSIGVKGLNLSFVPQTLYYDYMLLKKNILKLEKGAKVFIGVCPFVFCVDNYKNFLHNFRYYKIISNEEIFGFSPICFFLKYYFPLFFNPKRIKYVFKDLSSDVQNDCVETYCDQKEAAALRVSAWKKEFDVNDFEDLSQINETLNLNFQKNIIRLNCIIKLVKDNNCEPIIVIPPVTDELKKLVSKKALENYLYSNLRKANIDNVKIFDYFDSAFFGESKLFINSDMLNKQGRKLFTENIIERSMCKE